MPLRWCRPAAPRARVRFAATRPCSGRGRVGLPSPAGGVSRPFRSGSCPGGVSCLLPLLCRRPWCGPPAPVSRPGPVAPWVCRSARPTCRGRVSWRWPGFPRSPPVAASRGRGGRAVARVFASSAAPRWARAGACRCRWRRRRLRLVVVARLAPLGRRVRRALWRGGLVFPLPPLVGGLFGGVSCLLFLVSLASLAALRPCRFPGAGFGAPVVPSRLHRPAARCWWRVPFGVVAGMSGFGPCQPCPVSCWCAPRPGRSGRRLAGLIRPRPPVSGFCRRRSVAAPRIRGRAAARLRALLALAAPPWRGRGGLFLARPRWSGGPPRRRVWLGGGRPGGGFAPPLAGGGALGGPPAVRVVGSAGRWFFSLSFSFCSRYFFPPGAAFLAALAGIKDTKFS